MRDRLKGKYLATVAGAALVSVVGAVLVVRAAQTNYLGTVFIADPTTPTNQLHINGNGSINVVGAGGGSSGNLSLTSSTLGIVLNPTPITPTSGASTITLPSFGNCTDTGGQHLNFGGGNWSCGNSSSGGGGGSGNVSGPTGTVAGLVVHSTSTNNTVGTTAGDITNLGNLTLGNATIAGGLTTYGAASNSAATTLSTGPGQQVGFSCDPSAQTVCNFIGSGANPVTLGWGVGVALSSHSPLSFGSDQFDTGGQDVFGWRIGPGILAIGNSTFQNNGGTLQVGFIGNTTFPSDSGTTDKTVCEVGNGTLAVGSGTLGICLGTSSKRFKTDAGPLREGLSEILALQPRQFYLDKAHGDPTKLMYGFYAEDALAVLPKLVGFDAQRRPNTFDYLGVVPVLVHAVQQDNAKEEIEVAKLETENADLKHRLSVVESQLGIRSVSNETFFERAAYVMGWQ